MAGKQYADHSEVLRLLREGMQNKSKAGVDRAGVTFDAHTDWMEKCEIVTILLGPKAVETSALDMHKKALERDRPTLVEELFSITNYIFTRAHAALLHLCEGYIESHHLAILPAINVVPILLSVASEKTLEQYSRSFDPKKHPILKEVEEDSDIMETLEEIGNATDLVVRIKMQSGYRNECETWFAKTYPFLAERITHRRDHILKVFSSGHFALSEPSTLDDMVSFMYPVDITQSEYKDDAVALALEEFYFTFAQIFIIYHDTLLKKGYDVDFRANGQNGVLLLLKYLYIEG